MAPGARSFLGYVREDGRVGTRNEIWILPTVGCVGRTAERIAAEARALDAAGCFAIVIEMVPSPAAQRVTEALRIPVIGIGASAAPQRRT